MRICVYCASSQRIDRIYLETARSLGGILAKQSVTIVYGGGGTGSMGAVADGALEEGGHVVGVIPEFMYDRHRLMWGVVEHPEEVLTAIENAPDWSSEARSFASLR